jgi:glutamyl-tRNA synthetase
MTVTRFAPSPTGYLHIGGLRTALFSYLWARKNGGKFLLRIEDTDLQRNSKDATKAILEAFNWLGLDSDGEVVYQSQRFDLYKKYIDQLLEEGKAYKCYMSKEELDALRQEQQSKKQRPRYDGRYRDFTGTPPANIKPVIRIKAPLSGKIEFKDGVKGSMSFEVNDVLDDFIISRSDGTPTYNFVVAIDDALMGVNEVIRGDDHLMNTPKQIVVYNALNLTIPKFYHVPMILNDNGKKLSKRDGAMDVMEYKKNGFLPQALINFLIRLGWSHKDQEIFSMSELLKYFDPNDINKSASIYNTSKLEWINAEYIKTTPVKELCNLTNIENEFLVELLTTRANTLVELQQKANLILNEPITYNEKDVKKHLKPEKIEILKQFLEVMRNTNLETLEEYKNLVNNFLEQTQTKMPHLAQPLRIALTGTTNTPNISEVLYVVGKEEVLKRVEKLLATC